MFVNKVVGAARTALLEQLFDYYNTGVSCLLLSPTLRAMLEPAFCSRVFVVVSAEGHDKDVADLDSTACNEIFNLVIRAEKLLSHWLILLSAVDKLSRSSLSPYQALTVQCFTARILTTTAFIMVNNISHHACKTMYKIDRIVCNMLQLASRVGPVSQSLYLAMYYYRTGRYNEALHVTYLTKQRLLQPFIMFKGNVDRQKYTEAVGSLSLSKRMKTAWADNVKFVKKVHYIDELLLEQEEDMDGLPLYIPALVMSDMLLVLSHCRQGNRSQSQQPLADLQTLLLYDEGRYVPFSYRDLSWQILGICQQVVGDLDGALHSYYESLNYKHQIIHKSTEKRIAIVLRQLER
jgi:hypothetical protein